MGELSDTQTEALHTKLLERLPEARVLRIVEPRSPVRAGERFEIWSCGATVFIVHVYGEGNGAEVYVPATESNSIGATVERVANLVKEKGQWPSVERRS